MIQIVAQRKGFVFTNPIIVVPESRNIFLEFDKILAQLKPEDHENLYYTVAHHNGIEGARTPQRTAGTFAYQTVIAFDIDYCDVTRPRDYLEVMADVLRLPPEAITQVCSGNGFQFVVHLKKPIRDGAYFKENKPYYNEVLTKVSLKLIDAGLPGTPDPVIFEAARVMRLPGTINQKPGIEPKRCILLQYSDAECEMDLKDLAGIGDISKDNVTPVEMKRQYPRPDFETIYSSCEFIKWCVTNPTELHEPHVFDLFSLLGAMPATVKIIHEDQEKDAATLGKWVFDNASSSKSLARTSFDTKWSQATRYGCRKCSTVDERWNNRCQSCPFFGKVVTPLAIKSDEHIGSEDNGYWVLNKKGAFVNPHYEDLAKVFSKENNFLVDEAGRFLVYRDNYYVPFSDIQIKSWIERKVRPSHPLMERHRNEFVHKLYSLGALQPEMSKAVFETNVYAKLNLRNGILDILAGELLPHSPSYGFLYKLEYDYTPGVSSEFFIDWLAYIMDDTPELMNTVLDVMAYCLWSGYEDHVFTYFTGEGSNGKSTVIEILQAIVGEKNYTAMSLDRLTTNRFAVSGLVGKMANLSEESSGGKINSLEINTLKTLSSGGVITTERKGADQFDFRNKAKLVFSANKNPIFTETSDALTRRLLVIPFRKKIHNRDANIGKRLCTVEIPGILNLLIERIKENVKANDGKFIINRSLEVTSAIQEKFLMEGNSVAQWFESCCESSVRLGDGVFLSVGDAFGNYRQWCEDAAVTPMNKMIFGRLMNKLTTTSAEGTVVKKINGKPERVYLFTRLKDYEL